MWSNTVTALVVSVNAQKGRDCASPVNDAGKSRRGQKVRFWFALPIPLFLMFLDMAEDWALLLTPFVNSKAAGRRARYAWAGIRVIKELALELCFETGPTDFVDIDANGKNNKARVRILTR